MTSNQQKYTGVAPPGDEGAFLDALYAATLAPKSWVGVLEQLADMLGGTSAWISNLNVHDGRGSGLGARLDPAWADAYLAHYHRLNPFISADPSDTFLRPWRPEALTDDVRMPRDDLVASEYFNDFMRPQEVDHVLIIRLARSARTVRAININRSQARGAFSRNDQARAAGLLEHIGRAYEISARLADAATAQTEFAEAIHALPQAMLVLGPDGRVRHANAAADALLLRRTELRVVGGRLTATPPALNRTLQARIGVAATDDAEMRRGGSLGLPSADGGPPLSITISPLRAGSDDVFGVEPSVLVCIGDLAARTASSQTKLAQLFGLTPAEARVAAAVQAGARLRDIAEALKVSPNTVRVHLAHVFEKTGVARQADLARMLNLIAPG